MHNKMPSLRRLAVIALLTLSTCISLSYLTFCFFYYLVAPLQGIKFQEFTKGKTPRIKIAAQMEELFGPSSRFISFEGNQEPIWNTQLFLYGRYELCMQVPLKVVSATNGNVVGNPEFFLDEIDRIGVPAGASAGLDVKIIHQWRFTQKKWDILYHAKGDFRTIGINLNTNAPVENIEALIKYSEHP
jgi:hypothetical protein